MRINMEIKELDLSKIVNIDFPENQYYREETNKNQIVLHHTVSGKGIDGDIATWLSDPSRIATHFIIERNGVINQCFSSKYWGHHLGLKSDFLQKNGFGDFQTRNVILNKGSISIEIDSWGMLTKNLNGTYNSCYNKQVTPDIQVIEYANKYRGGNYFEKYTNEQIKSVGELIVYLVKKYNISLKYNEDIWDVSKNALNGNSGIYTHSSYRNDKSDCHPQPELINLLKTLKL